jgi:transcriptional regulator with XRE-family HTH domain
MIRKENKKTQEEVADFLGITKQAYFRYEKGTRRISLDNLLKITKYYNLDSDYFFGKFYSIQESNSNNFITYSKYYYDLKDKYDYFIVRVKLLEEDTINDRTFIGKELKLAFDEINYLKSELKQTLSSIELLLKSEKEKY